MTSTKIDFPRELTGSEIETILGETARDLGLLTRRDVESYTSSYKDRRFEPEKYSICVGKKTWLFNNVDYWHTISTPSLERNKLYKEMTFSSKGFSAENLWKFTLVLHENVRRHINASEGSDNQEEANLAEWQ